MGENTDPSQIPWIGFDTASLNLYMKQNVCLKNIFYTSMSLFMHYTSPPDMGRIFAPIDSISDLKIKETGVIRTLQAREVNLPWLATPNPKNRLPII